MVNVRWIKPLIVLLVVAGCFGWLFWMFVEAEQTAKQTEALVRAKQLSKALFAYAEDNGGYYPLGVQSGVFPQAALGPYLPHASYDLIARSTNPKSHVWAFNSALTSINVLQISDPGRTIAVFDSQDWPNGRRCVAFVNGGAKRLMGHEAVEAVTRRFGLMK